MSTRPSLAPLFQCSLLAELPPGGVRLIAGLRCWGYARERGRWPVDAIQRQLGCVRAAAHVRLLIEEIAAAWPDPFCLAPPCCRAASHDEALIARMLARASARDRPGFDRLCAEMIGEDARERMFLGLSLIGAALAA